LQFLPACVARRKTRIFLGNYCSRALSNPVGIAVALLLLDNKYPRSEERAMMTIRTIVHATDFSENSDVAFRLACALARDYDARLVVLHVVAVPPAVGYAEGIMIPDAPPLREELMQRLNEIQSDDADAVIERRLVEGDVATEILRAAQDAHGDMIVIGTHGRGGLTRLLMGSVAEQVVRRASCPVVTVRQPLPENVLFGENTAQLAATPVGSAPV
jgi:nucleotide-binding universal stress UspA family protein